jgi:hypothetical protein
MFDTTSRTMNVRKRPIDDALISLNADASACRESMNHQRKRRLIRTVRFADDGDATPLSSTPSTSLQVTYNVENVLNLVNKEELWVQPNESLDIITSIHEECAQFQQSITLGTESYLEYSDALQTSYFRCCQDIDNGDDHYNHCKLSNLDKAGCIDMPNIHSCFQYQILGSRRGIEAHCVPTLAVARLTVRKNMIQNVVLLHQLLRNETNRDVILGCIASQFTQPSKRFAHMMGIVDAMNAAMANIQP